MMALETHVSRTSNGGVPAGVQTNYTMGYSIEEKNPKAGKRVRRFSELGEGTNPSGKV